MLPLIGCDSIGRIIPLQLYVLFCFREEMVVDQISALEWCNGQYNWSFPINNISILKKHIQTLIGYGKINGHKFYLGIEIRGILSLRETKLPNSKKNREEMLFCCEQTNSYK